jgi:hypothetical protein
MLWGMAIYHHRAIFDKEERRIAMCGEVVRNRVPTALWDMQKQESMFEEEWHVYNVQPAARVTEILVNSNPELVTNL